jgi:hypothetical protein
MLNNRWEGEMTSERADAYRHFAEHCVELAREMNAPQDRTILLEMALLWSRLAEFAAKGALPKEPVETV